MIDKVAIQALKGDDNQPLLLTMSLVRFSQLAFSIDQMTLILLYNFMDC